MGTWGDTERAVELPLSLDFLDRGGKVLEIGNVTRPHVSTLSHNVIDLTEKREGWVNYANEDVLTYEPERDLDRVLSISTVEHTMDVVLAIKRILSWADNALITIPLGYNTPGGMRTDDAVFQENYPSAKITILGRTPGETFIWRQIPIEEAQETGFDGFRYGQFERGATAIAVLEK
jgi:hypothetical protein